MDECWVFQLPFLPLLRQILYFLSNSVNVVNHIIKLQVFFNLYLWGKKNHLFTIYSIPPFFHITKFSLLIIFRWFFFFVFTACNLIIRMEIIWRISCMKFVITTNIWTNGVRFYCFIKEEMKWYHWLEGRKERWFTRHCPWGKTSHFLQTLSLFCKVQYEKVRILVKF